MIHAAGFIVTNASDGAILEQRVFDSEAAALARAFQLDAGRVILEIACLDTIADFMVPFWRNFGEDRARGPWRQVVDGDQVANRSLDEGWLRQAALNAGVQVAWGTFR